MVQQPMSDERLAEIRAREQAATVGPWAYTRWDDTFFMATFGVRAAERVVAYAEHDRGPECADEDMDFIAAARQDVPDLLSEVERLRTRNAALAAVLREHMWIGDIHYSFQTCLACGHEEPHHGPNCVLVAALEGVE